ncbi:MAG: hypothetical protein KGS61_02835 [Verrucomicrobia bacterium]|nr:hypothetical protein [Verrucomicrobiota bacterium]
MSSSLPQVPTSDSGREMDAWFTPGRFAVALAVLIIAAFPEVVLGAGTFFFRDFGLFAYPLAYYHRESFWHGQIPLWNPYSDCGVPFLAQWNTMVLYPLSLFYVLLPLSWALGMFCLSHLFLGGMGMCFLARRWTGNGLAASVAGMAFAFNGLTLHALMWTNNSAALGWMPWVVLATERAWREGGRCVVLAALVGAMQMLAGAPEIILLTWLFVGALWAGESQISDFRFQIEARRLARLLGVVAMIAGLAAAQLLPFADLLAHSQRGQQFGDSAWSMPVWGWANFLVPLFRCYPSSQGVYFQYNQFWTSSYYHSIGVLALALFAAGRVRRRRVWLLAAVAALSLVLALGDAGGLYGWLRRVCPLVGFMRFPIKFVVLPIFIIPVLAGFAVQHCQDLPVPAWVRERGRIAVLAGLLVAGLAGLLWFARYHPLPRDQWSATWQSGLARVAFLGLILGTFCASRQVPRPALQRLLRLALLFLVWLDVTTHSPRLNPTAPRWVYQPGWARAQLKLNPQPALGLSRVMLTPDAEFRLDHSSLENPAEYYAFDRLGLFSNCNLLDDVPKVNGFFSLYVRETARVEGLIYAVTNVNVGHLADFLAVSQETALGKATFWKSRPSCLPWVTAGQRPVFGRAPNILWALVDPQFDPRQMVLLPPEAKRELNITNASRAKVEIRQFQAQWVELEVEARQAVLVVIAQSFYHLWEAYVDDRPARLWRANYAFQAVAVPAGRHRVRLVYEDRPFQIGVVVSVVTLLVCAGLWRRAGATRV